MILQVAILHGIVENGGDADRAAGRSPHPENIVVAPFDIHGMMIHQPIQNHVRMGAAVKNIADDMQTVDRHALNQVAQGDNKRL